ncbi:hypothetical protein OsJ_20216 [Oryza sativa Japonica Group]|uniref:Uncharacterized protein n=1 Tax=Oryza sativa subsp. japonica TaxID=39947 RepID=B9FRM8_ORYSJ|nr:hypothetical protein OsJ_20216 [Oryza sativa Japonica Group]
MMNEAEREAVAIQLGWISDLLADTERLIASNRGYVRDLLESIDDGTCPFTFAELQDEIRDLRESRAVDAALDGIKEMLDDVRAILTRASSHGARDHDQVMKELPHAFTIGIKNSLQQMYGWSVLSYR